MCKTSYGLTVSSRLTRGDTALIVDQTGLALISRLLRTVLVFRRVRRDTSPQPRQQQRTEVKIIIILNNRKST